jgi:hypothetical protein
LAALKGYEMNIQLGFIAFGGILSVVIYHGISGAVASFRRWRELRKGVSQQTRINRY